MQLPSSREERELHVSKCIFLFQLTVSKQEVTKEVAHGKKISKMQKNLVKLPYSALSTQGAD